MTEYALTVFGMCALLGALSLIHYNKSGAEKCAARVLFAAAILLPLLDTAVSFEYELPTLPPSSDTSRGEYTEVASSAFASGVGQAVCTRFSLPESSVEVEISGFDITKMRAEKIKITLSGMAIAADRRAIENFIEDEGLGECEVKLRVG